jgi:hypothetical protein
VAGVFRANPNPPRVRAPRTPHVAISQDKITPSFGRRNRNSNWNSTDLISDALPLDRLCYGGPKAISYAKFYSRLGDAVICVY